MGCSYGSIWRKWDFHVHTPYSILNNNFGFNPFEMTEENLEKAFDTYVINLFSFAVVNNIAAIGITDYFMIEGYKRIKEKYLASTAKMQQCFPDKELRKKIEQIYVFPNIELRLDTFVGRNANSVNYHIIFSGESSICDIEENFLHQLQFEYDAGNSRPLTLSNIEDLGKQIKKDNGASGSNLFIGLKHVTIHYADVQRVLENNNSFHGMYLITVPVDEDLSQIQWSGRDYSTRRNLYKQCHALMTANENTAKWALAKNHEEEQIREFGSIKPCIWGSDAHEYDRMFKPDGDKYCWIKAEPCFEGLLQILYEPEERVKIQSECPETKDPHQVIDTVLFEDSNFQTNPIVFNDALTCIIGGKSTGKSLLLRQMAFSIDAEHVISQEKTGFYQRKQLEVQKVTVTWKDGTTGSRKIVYIPQTFLNRTIDNPEKSTAINKIIEDVLLQEPEILAAHSEWEETLDRIKRRVQTDIQEVISQRARLSDIDEAIKREGLSITYDKTIRNLETERINLAEKVNISQEEIDRFAVLEKTIQSLNTRFRSLCDEFGKYKNLPTPQVIIPGYFSVTDGQTIVHDFSEDFPDSSNQLQGILLAINDQMISSWEIKVKDISAEVLAKSIDIKKELDKIQEEYNLLKVKVAQSEQLQKLTNRINNEREKLIEAKERENSKKKIEEKITDCEKRIIASQADYLKAYMAFSNTVKTSGTQKDTSLIFDAKVVWKQNEFIDSLTSVFNNRNFTSFKSVYQFDLTDLSSDDYGEELLTAIWNAMDNQQAYGGLTVKANNSLETTLQRLFDDWYNIHYIVTSGQDTIEEMSPGKKALVLLELLISLEDSKCPILIDQPEDDLDNRSIYNDLVQFIRRKKKERQIIIVTHNANVVLGADAEEIIIANQKGKDTENAERRFEYRSGAIENDEVIVDNTGNPIPGILNQAGIQTQICDILEGGRVAFQLRQNKYATIS